MLSKDWPSYESRQNVDFYVRPAFRVLVLPIKGFTAYYTAFNSSFSVSLETAFMDSPLKQNLRGWVGGWVGGGVVCGWGATKSTTVAIVLREKPNVKYSKMC